MFRKNNSHISFHSLSWESWLQFKWNALMLSWSQSDIPDSTLCHSTDKAEWFTRAPGFYASSLFAGFQCRKALDLKSVDWFSKGDSQNGDQSSCVGSPFEWKLHHLCLFSSWAVVSSVKWECKSYFVRASVNWQGRTFNSAWYYQHEVEAVNLNRKKNYIKTYSFFFGKSWHGTELMSHQWDHLFQI